MWVMTSSSETPLRWDPMRKRRCFGSAQWKIELERSRFALQSQCMESNWAAEHLQTIRTLMERSALYRRALGPIMLLAGFLGGVTATAGLWFQLDSLRSFVALWFSAAVAALAGAFLIARRQALKEKEPFWSPPTRRVAHALLPPLTSGMCLGMVFVAAGVANELALAFIWLLFYGCAMHAAGAFMPRGVKWFGWIFIGLACGGLLVLAVFCQEASFSAHWLMGFFFGFLHLAYGAYLSVTEKGKNAA
jgi:hypothetical protein